MLTFSTFITPFTNIQRKASKPHDNHMMVLEPPVLVKVNITVWWIIVVSLVKETNVGMKLRIDCALKTPCMLQWFIVLIITAVKLAACKPSLSKWSSLQFGYRSMKDQSGHFVPRYLPERWNFNSCVVPCCGRFDVDNFDVNLCPYALYWVFQKWKTLGINWWLDASNVSTEKW